MASQSLKVGGEDCTQFNADLFSRLRTQLGYDSWVFQALETFDFGKLAVRARPANAR